MELTKAEIASPTAAFLQGLQKYPAESTPILDKSFEIPFGGKNYDVYLYLARECSGGWFPSFKHGQATVKCIMNCLRTVAEERCADIKAGYPEVSISSKRNQEHASPTHTKTLREEVEVCRSLCSDALASLAADMDDICTRSGGLWTESGPLVRALKHYDETRAFGTEPQHYIKRTEDAHLEMLSILALVANRWGRLRDQISWLDGILSTQLRRLATTKSSLRARSLATQTDLETMRRQVVQLQEDIYERTKAHEHTTAQKNNTDHGFRHHDKLVERLEIKGLNLRQLIQKGESTAKHFKEAEKQEEERRQKSEKTGWGEWAWDAMWNPIGNYNQLQQAADWEVKVKEHEDEEAARNINIFELKKEIDDLEHEIEHAQLKDHHASEIQKQHNRQIKTQETRWHIEKMDMEEELESLEKKIQLCTNAIAVDVAMIAALNKYEDIVPRLSGFVKEAQASIDNSFRAYQHLHKKLQGCSAIIHRLSQQMQKQNLSSLEAKDLTEDIVFLRINYLVISDMAGRTVTVSRELYSEDLRVLAPLSVLSASDRGQDDQSLEQLSEVGGDAAANFDKAQKDAFNRLCVMVEEIIISGTLKKPQPESKSLLKVKDQTVAKLEAKPVSKWRNVLKR